jgi:hypothetical protein
MLSLRVLLFPSAQLCDINVICACEYFKSLLGRCIRTTPGVRMCMRSMRPEPFLFFKSARTKIAMCLVNHYILTDTQRLPVRDSIVDISTRYLSIIRVQIAFNNSRNRGARRGKRPCKPDAKVNSL